MAIPTAELNRRVQVTATKSWGPTPAGEVVCWLSLKWRGDVFR